jgi:hypothetical protein
MKKWVLAVCLALPACQSSKFDESVSLAATEGYSKEDTDKLFVVDCLLPPQIRKLGSQMTYLAKRRAIRTTAGDCEIRGGEYVAYDRSNYASALNVWLPQATQGDPEAQVMLGEIYEKGLGGVADPAMAAEWYKRAALQGNSRAQLNLGNLYEKGLGVEKNLTTALNWYRKASGLDNTDLEFASVTEARVSANYEQKLQELQKTAADYQQQAQGLQQKLSKARQHYATEKDKLKKLEQELNRSRQQLEQEKQRSSTDQQKVQQLEQQLSRQENDYNEQKLQVAESYREEQSSAQTFKDRLALLQQQLVLSEEDYHNLSLSIQSEMQQIASKSAQASSTKDKLEIEHLRTQLKDDKAALLKMAGHIKQLKTNIADNSQIIKSLETAPDDAIRLAEAGIEIIEPTMVLTRGVPSFQLRSITASKKIVGKIADLKALKSLSINGAPVSVDDQGIFQSDVRVSEASNPVEIIAMYHQKEAGRLTFNILAKNPEPDLKRTQPVQAVTKAFPNLNFGRFYALIIGNQNYSQLPTLKTSENDARTIEQILRTRYGYQTTLLINADRHRIMTAFNELRKNLTEEDNLLIYYAGHGEIDKADNSAYWLPVDAEQNNPANWLSSHNITQFISIMPARHILVVADSCYSGAMTQTSVSRLPDEMSDDKRAKWLKFMLKRKARTVMTSGGVKPVLDSGGGDHSIFANAFIDVLNQNSGLVEDYELYRAVSANVQRRAAAVGFQQEPQYSALSHSGHEGSPYFFVHNN